MKRKKNVPDVLITLTNELFKIEKTKGSLFQAFYQHRLKCNLMLGSK
jgi:hypothetical protein